MNDKELLRQLRELLVERKNNVDSDNTNSKDAGSQTMSQSYGSKQIKLGTHPNAGNLFAQSTEAENTITKNGFSTVFMLGFLTMFFQALFLVISYFIFK
jgi:hypothetical protein